MAEFTDIGSEQRASRAPTSALSEEGMEPAAAGSEGGSGQEAPPNPGHKRRSRGRKLLVLGVVVAALSAAGAVLGAVRPWEQSTSAKTATTIPSPVRLPNGTLTCAKSGCGVVSSVLNNTRPTVFYGASCTGIVGSWYLNVVQGGPNNLPRVAYKLSWQFPSVPSSVRPSGNVVVSGSTTPITMTVSNGVVTLTGTAQNGSPVNATGSLVVAASGSHSGSILTVTESGLSQAENALGITSPFEVNSQPVSVPVKTTATASTC